MARIELRDTDVILQDGFGGTAKVDDTSIAQGNTTLEIDAVANLTNLTNVVPVGARLQVTGHVTIYTVTGQNANEKQVVTLTGATGGTFMLIFSGQTTAGIAWNAAASAVLSALEALSNINVGDVLVTGNAGGPWTVEFRGQYLGLNVASMTINGASLIGTNEKQTAGIPNTVDVGTFTLTYSGQTTAAIAYNAVAATVQTALENLSNIEVGDVEVTGGPGPGTDWVVEFKGTLASQDVVPMTATSSCGQNEKQTAGIPDTVDVGTFTLTYSGQTTAAIAYDAAAAAVQTALENLSNIEVGDVLVTGGPGPGTDWVVEFKGALAITDVVAMTATSSCGRNEKQTVAIDDATTSGTFTLTYSSQTTGTIAWNATAAAVQTALEGLSNIEVGDVLVTGGPGPGTDWVVEFKGTLAITDVAAMTGDGTNLVGGSTVVTITETVKGVTEIVTITETVKGVTEVVTITETVKGVNPTEIVTTLRPGATTWELTFTPSIPSGDVPANDDDIVFLPQNLEIKIGDGNITYTEHNEFKYDLDRGDLDTVREGNQVPMDVKLEAVFEHITQGLSEPVSPMDALKGIGGASAWVSSSLDLCEPYGIDLIVKHTPPCGTAQLETVTFPDFRSESREINYKDATISVSGKCKVTEPIVTRTDAA